MAGIERKIRVLIVDDSLLIRNVLEKELNKNPAIEVVGTAANPIEARTMIASQRPDVLTLDIEMPKMNGLTFLRFLQKHNPIPVVVLSTLTPNSSVLALEALRFGATEVMQKPGGGSFLALGRVIEQLVFKIKAAAVAERRNRPKPAINQPLSTCAEGIDREIVIGIGASTGGTEALRYILSRLPGNLPPIVVVQHMPEAFTAPFAESLNNCSQVRVVEASQPIEMRSGLAVMARGGQHLVLARNLNSFRAVPQAGEPVCYQCPSVDVLFDSMARLAAPKIVGVILTGMGEDGAAGLLAMRQAGAATIAQDKATCVVFGMPKAAIECGAVQHVLPLDKIPHAIISAAQSKSPSDTRDACFC